MLMRFDPFAELDRVTRQVLGNSRPSFVPVDAYRLGDRFYLHVDLPGVDNESIDVTVDNNTLTVSAERKFADIEGASWLVNERPQGTFTRQFYLGDGLDPDQIEAGYDHGVLTISIPVAEQAKPRRISVGMADKALTS
jgi:HSP20 family protein